MKIKSIARICAQSKSIFIYDKKQRNGGNDVQWIGDGYAIYPVLDLPRLGAESIFTIFDVPEKNRDKYFFKHDKLPETISCEDVFPCENMLDSEKLDIAKAGKILRPLQTQRGLVFIDTKYLSPLSDMADTLELYERLSPGGQVYIVAKTGFMLMAVIYPYDLISKEFVNQMENLTKQCRFALSNKESIKAYEDKEQDE